MVTQQYEIDANCEDWAFLISLLLEKMRAFQKRRRAARCLKQFPASLLRIVFAVLEIYQVKIVLDLNSRISVELGEYIAVIGVHQRHRKDPFEVIGLEGVPAVCGVSKEYLNILKVARKHDLRCLKRLAKRLNIPRRLTSAVPDTQFRNRVNECLDSKAKAEESGTGDTSSDGLRIKDDSVSDVHRDPRSPADAFCIESTKVGDTTVDSFNPEDDSASGSPDEEILMTLNDSAADTCDEAHPNSLRSLEIENIEIEDESPTEVPRARIEYLPTEILQLIFMELPTLEDAKRINGSCYRMRAAFKEYEHGITWVILSRELGPLLSGTLGALAIFASIRNGVFDEPLLGNMGISTRYWGKMLREHGEKAKKLLTPTRAVNMLEVYRLFPRMIRCGPVGAKCCSACRSIALAEADWDPMTDSSNGNCMQHLLQANAVRWRLNCRMVMDFTQLSEVLEDIPCDKWDWDWDPEPIVRKIMRQVECKPDEESELEADIARDDNIGFEHQLKLENDSAYGVEPGVEDRVAIVQLDNISLEPKVCSEDSVYHGEQIRKKDKVRSEAEIQNKENFDPGGELQQKGQLPTQSKVFPKKGLGLHQVVEVYQEAEIYPAEKIRQEIELLEQENKEIELWFRSDEANALLRS